ncbi:MAG: PD-(D/E)XK nuclease family protein [Pseudomonadales bacterium]
MAIIDVINELPPSSVIISSSEYLARDIRFQSAWLKGAAGEEAWIEDETVMSINSWMQALWDDTLPELMVLSPTQALVHMKSIVDRSGLLPANLISSTSIARKALASMRTVLDWGIELDEQYCRLTVESEALIQWEKSFKVATHSQGFFYQPELPYRLTKLIGSGMISVPSTIAVVGMATVLPSQQMFLDAMEAAGATVVMVDPSEPCEDVEAVIPETADAEIDAIACWANNLLMPFVENQLAAPNIGIIVPDLRKDGAKLIRRLETHVCPQSMIACLPSNSDPVRVPWELAGGSSLASYPLIRTAFNLVSLADNVPLEQLSTILLSRYIIGTETERSQRASVDLKLRQIGSEELPLEFIGDQIIAATTINVFAERFQNLVELIKNEPETAYPSKWSEYFTRRLDVMGWAQGWQLQSEEFQTVKAWDEAIAEFCTLDHHLGSINYERAVMWFREIIDTRQFQPRLSYCAPITILSTDHAIGIEFDNVWFAGLSADVLPGTLDPDAFIPRIHQEEVHHPSVDNDFMLEAAERVKRFMVSSAKQVRFSCAKQFDDGGAAVISPLLSGYDLSPGPGSKAAGAFSTVLNLIETHGVHLTEMIPKVNPAEAEGLSGGISIIKAYNTQPFYAFAKNRLGLTEFPVKRIGLDSRVQGDLLHAVLEYFFNRVTGSVQLATLTDEECVSLIGVSVNNAFTKVLGSRIHLYGLRLVGLEKRRVTSLVNEWLDLERQRELPFEVVATECPMDVSIGGLYFKVRIDRIDRILAEDGKADKYVLIDYKSGEKVSMLGMNAEQLLEPQLPLYASLIDPAQSGLSSIDGVCLAHVAQKPTFHMRSSWSNSLTSKKSLRNDVDSQEKWNGQVDAWRSSIEQTVEEFIQGEALMDMPIRKLELGFEFLRPILSTE